MITAHDEGFIGTDLLHEGRSLADKAIALLNGYVSYLRKSAKTKPALEGGISQ